MKNSRSEQWSGFESVVLGTTIVACALAVILLPFLIPRELPASWPTIVELYDALGMFFPYLARSLPLSSDPEFYMISKVVLFGVGTLNILVFSLLPLSRNVIVRELRVVDEARRPIWWFWLLFAVAGYGIFFDTYKPNGGLSWASKAAVASPVGIAAGNFVQFGVFTLTAAYIVLIKHYLRVRSVWGNGHGRN